MKLGIKIILPILLLLVIVTGAGGYIFYNLQAQETVISIEGAKIRALNGLNERLARQEYQTRYYVLAYRFNQDQASLLAITQAELNKSKTLDEMFPFITTSRGRELINSYIDTRKGIESLRNELIQAIDDGDQEQINLSYNKWNIKTQNINVALADIGAYNINSLEKTLVTMGDIKDKISGIIVISVLVVVATVLFLFFYLRVVITTPIIKLAQFADEVAKQNFTTTTTTTTTTRKDELGILSRAFNSMSEKLRLKAEALAVTAKEKEDVRRKLALATDKLAREEKLATIGKLAGIMGHEIRNPLGVIRNSIYFLNMKFKESIDEKVKRHMDIMETEIVAADKIISDVLEFARTKPPSFATEEINSVVEVVLSKANIPETVKVETNLGENLPKINIDIAQVKQVFLNIISNAIEAMPKGGELRVTTSRTDSFISIAFKDTGVGIPKENIDKLFTPLFSTKIKGLGLGLAACQNIISAHRGKIEFESKEGQGTTLIIKLPIA